MAEVKTGLEGRLGWFTECGTLGKVYYTALHGSLGTKGLGVGTAATNGTNLLTVGSGYVNCSGVWKYVSATQVAAGSAGAETICVNVEVGSDGVVDVTAGGTAEGVSAAIAARTATKAGHAPLAYVTVGTGGSVIGGSIVNERSFHTAGTISYLTGLDYSLEENKKDIWDRATFSHYKAGRDTGKLTIKELYVEQGSSDIWPTSSTYHTVPTVAFELAIDGINGTVSEALLFQRCGKDSTSLSQPEEDMTTFDISATFGSLIKF